MTPGGKKYAPHRISACYGRLTTTTVHKNLGGATVAIIAQKSIFGWEEVESLGDLQRLNLVLESLPDEELMAKLEAQRAETTTRCGRCGTR